MTDLAAQLRAVTDSAAEPIGLEEVRARSAPEEAVAPRGRQEGRPRSDRTVLLAAMAIFIAGLAGLVWYVTARSDPSAPMATTGALYALPPADAANLQVIYPEDPPYEDQGAFRYDDPVLGPVQLHTSLMSTSGFTDAQTVAKRAQDAGFDARVTEVQGFGAVTVICFTPSDSGDTLPDGAIHAGEGTATASPPRSPRTRVKQARAARTTRHLRSCRR